MFGRGTGIGIDPEYLRFERNRVIRSHSLAIDVGQR